jgi:hypothetical protein
MNIREYIENPKHGLTLLRVYPDFKPDNLTGFGRVRTRSLKFPSIFLEPQPETSPKQDPPPPTGIIRYEIYGNAEQTHFVSLNITQGRFRIIHWEIILAVSEWLPINREYEPRKADPAF